MNAVCLKKGIFGSMRSMKRYLFFVLVTALAILGSPALAAASGNAETTVTYKMSAPTYGLTAKMADDPPSGGCALDIGGLVHAQYINTILAETEAEYWAEIDCDAFTSGETMRHLWVGAEQYRNGTLAQPDASPGECSHEVPSHPTCVHVRSEQVALCLAVSMVCSGDYWVTGGYSLLLPAGWVWNTISPNCLRLAPAEITCQLQTVPVDIPPIYVEGKSAARTQL